MDKCRALANKCLSEGKSVIIDNTNPSLEVSRTPNHRLLINPVAKPQFSERHGLGVLAARHVLPSAPRNPVIQPSVQPEDAGGIVNILCNALASTRC